MATYQFETITAQQAQSITAADQVLFCGGPARAASVTYQSYDPLALTPEPPRILVTYEGRTVAFGTDIVQVSRAGGLVMADGSRLAIGDAGGGAIKGGTGDDGLYGGPGADTLEGGGGDDLLHGGSGDDLLNGGAGANVIYGGQGADTVNASEFREAQGSWVHGNQGDDFLAGGDGADTIYGGQGDDFIGGKDGDDWISGDRGGDEIHAGSGNDTVSGGDGGDVIHSTDGSDLLRGDDGDDMLIVYGRGATTVDGGAGNDTMVSASQDSSVLYGGEGRDRFEIIANSPPREGADDVIADWQAGDRLHFPQVSIYSILPRQYSEIVAADYDTALSLAQQHITFTGATYVAAQVGSDVIVFADTNGDSSDGPDTAVVLAGRTLADIAYSDFV